MKITRLIIVFILIITSSTIFAQQGDYFVVNFTPGIGDRGTASFDLTFSSKGELFAANNKGILTFDGVRWRLINTPKAALSLALNEQNEIFIGCAGDFGKMELKNGQYEFLSLATDTISDIVTQTVSVGNKASFLTEHAAYVFDGEQTIKHASNDTETFHVIFEFDDRLFVQSDEALYEIQNDNLTETYLLPQKKAVVAISEKHDARKYIMTGENGDFYLFDKKLTKLPFNTDQTIVSLNWVNDQTFAATTLSSGILFYHLSDGLSGEVSSQNGLPDDEIFATSNDPFGGLWITNDFGFARIAPNLPIRYFNYYPGLEGNIMSVAQLNNTWYLGTSKGVFYFEKVNKYKNVVYYEKKKKTTSATSKKKKKKGLFAKNNNSPKQKKSGNIFDNLKLNLTGYERKVRKELVSTSYVYKPVEGISEKIKDMVTFGDRLICHTPSGIAEIRNGEASMIIDRPAKSIYVNKAEDRLFISDFDGEVHLFSHSKNFWIRESVLETPGELVISFFEDSQAQTWLAGSQQLLKVDLSDEPKIIETYRIQNQFLDEIRLAEIGKKLYLINKEGIFYLDRETNEVVKDIDLIQQLGTPRNHLTQSDGRVWIHDGADWMRIENDKSISKFAYLKLAPRMTSIEERNSKLWIVNNHETLLVYEPSDSDSIPETKMYYRNIRAGQNLVNTEKVVIDYEQSQFNIEMARPDFLRLLNIEYQYKIEGISDTWSEWTDNNQINFSYLPAGSYTLQVNSRDALGRIQSAKPFEFEITPPYWQTVWFKGGQVLFFVLLVLGSARLNRHGEEKYKLLTSILTIVTVVMIIELLQNMAGSYFEGINSAIAAFAIDVAVALLVFPVEQLLKKVVSGQYTIQEAIPLDKIKSYVPVGNAAQKTDDNETNH